MAHSSTHTTAALPATCTPRTLGAGKVVSPDDRVVDSFKRKMKAAGAPWAGARKDSNGNRYLVVQANRSVKLGPEGKSFKGFPVKRYFEDIVEQ